MDSNILITGSNGQLGRELQLQFSQNERYNVFATDVAELDITDAVAVANFVTDNNINYIVNCAAYTAVDAAENNVELCTKLNVEAVKNISIAAESNGAKFIHISTDYVFDGSKCTPYKESDKPNPQSTYGSTKLNGEITAQKYNPDCIIIRTAWLYSPHGKNFVKTMIQLGREKDSLNVVFDQIGTPTSATDLANAIYNIITIGKWEAGIYHYSNEGVISWYDFTKAIHRISGISNCNVSPILSDQYPTPAIRPNYSVFDKTKIKSTFGIIVPYWEDSLKLCINRILTEDKL